jgi:hypothetical protein
MLPGIPTARSIHKQVHDGGSFASSSPNAPGISTVRSIKSNRMTALASPALKAQHSPQHSHAIP